MTRTLQLSVAAVLLAGWSAPLAAEGKPEAKAFDDAAFVLTAASCGIHEVEVGRIAATKAKTEAVKKFGLLMVDDHARLLEDLKQAARSANIAMPTKMSDEHQRDYERFKNYVGENFDRDYVKHMVADHEKGVAEFERASKDAANPAIKTFAKATLPILQGHLEAARKFQEQMK